MKLNAADKKIIEYWFLYLREHAGYKLCCESGGEGQYARLYADFGDVREDVSFEDWWPDHEHLFTPCTPFTVTVIENLDQLPAQDLNDGHALVVEINLHATKKDLLTAFRKLLTERHPGRHGRPGLIDTAEYPIASRMTVGALKTALAVYVRVRDDPKDEPDLSEIGAELRRTKVLRTGSSDKKGCYDEVLRQYQIAERLLKNIATDIPLKWSRFPLDE